MITYEKIQYEDLISKRTIHRRNRKIVNRANAERTLAQTVELMKVELEGKDSEITQLKLHLRKATATASSSSSAVSSPRTTLPQKMNNNDHDALRIESEQRLSESLSQAAELKKVKDLVNTQIAGV